jgi:predicted O-linked N-acetylglucosamine transferase (SPINDLY family)
MPADAKLQLALARMEQGDHAGAVGLLRPLVARAPDQFTPAALLAESLIRLGQLEQARYQIDRLARLAPHEADVSTLRVQLCGALGDLAGAVDAAMNAQRLAPHDPERARHLAVAAFNAGDFALMIDAARLGLAITGDDPDLLLKEASGLMSLGMADEARARFEAAVARHPQHAPLAEGLAVCLNYATNVPPAALRAAHDRLGDLLTGATAANPSDAAPPDRLSTVAGACAEPKRIRLGLISPDLRKHSVAYFLSPLLEHLDRARFELFAYSTWPVRPEHDAVTRRFHALVGTDHWRDAAGLSPAALARRVRDDRPDVLVDLAGLFQGNSLPALALRPAPLICTYLGYPATTGLPGVDARLVDAFTDPPGAEAHARERLVRINGCFLAYAPPTDAPPVRWRPAGAARPFTFASFNMLRKLNDPLLRFWGRILAGVPGSRLLIKAGGLEHARARGHWLDRAAAAGIEPQRVELVGHIADSASHLELYNRVDIALDTFPYHGTTTTCEALLMGTPVVSLIGDRHASRVGLSLLSAVGLSDLVTHREHDYVERAITLAGDPARLTTLRTTLRDRLLASPLTDGPGFARRWAEAVLTAMAQRA